jgi:hypothetical protein
MRCWKHTDCRKFFPILNPRGGPAHCHTSPGRRYVLFVYFVLRFHSLLSHPALSLARRDSLNLELNCIVQGDDTDHLFTVEIAHTKNVSALRKAIEEEKKHTFEQVDADTLSLWKVSALYRRWFTSY